MHNDKKTKLNPLCPKLHPAAFVRKESVPVRDAATGVQRLAIRTWCAKCQEEAARP